MKLLVCISKTPDTTAKISFTDNNQKFNDQGIQYIMNPYDEWYALVRALEIKEKAGGTVTIINVGLISNETILRKGLAIGADDAVRINAEPGSAYFTASQIAEYAREEKFDIILLGKETIDYNGSEVGAILSELLDIPFISYASHLEIEGNTATVNRDVEGGTEVVQLETPFAISAAKGMAEQRIPNMRGIMMAKNKPLKVIEPAVIEEMVSIISFALPPEKGGVKLVEPDQMKELVRLLHEEAKVI